MCDAVTLARVIRLGYSFDHDAETDTWWYRKSHSFVGPYRSMDDAAYGALTESEIQELMEKSNENQ